jgi:2-iminobutanoate/2-iminopropanoate deaminase
MTIKQTIFSDKLAPPVGPFSPAVRAGDFIFFSGQVAQDPASGKLVAGGVEREGEQIFANLSALLEAAGKSFSDVVRVGVFLTDMNSFAAVNAIYAKNFAQPFPARTTVGVATLPLGASVEIELLVKA